MIAWFEHDPTLTPYLQLATGVALAYAFYAVFVGAANGRKEFHKQAGLDMTYSTLRCLFVVGAAALTHSALAAVGGFVGAAFAVLDHRPSSSSASAGRRRRSRSTSRCWCASSPASRSIC